MPAPAGRPRGIRLQLLALFGVLVCTVATVLLVEAGSQRSTRATLEQLTDEALAGLRLIKSVTDAYQQDVVNTAFRVRNHLIGHEQGERLVARARERVAADWERLRAMQPTLAQRELVLDIERVRIDADRAAERLELLLQAGDADALGRFADSELHPAVEPVLQRLGVLADLTLQEAGRITEGELQRRWIAFLFSMGVSLVALLVVVGVGRGVLRNLLGGIESLDALARAMQMRDMRHQPGFKPAGELGEVMDSFLDMRADVMGYEREIIEQLRQNEVVREELESRNSALDAILAAAQVSIITVDPDGRINAANPFAQGLLGYAAGELAGEDCLVLHVPAELDAFAAALGQDGTSATMDSVSLLRAMADGAGGPRECHYVRKDGGQVPVLLAVSRIRTAEGGPLGYVGVATDLTRIKALEDRLRASEAQAREASEAKSAFLAAMSHEIRTPMIGVTGMLEVLSHSDLDAEQRHAIAVIQQSAGSLLQIIGDILDFSKIEAGRLELARTTVDLATLVRSTVANFVGSASSKGLTLDCHVDAKVAPALQADPLRIRQILANFLSNAIKFTERGGIRVSIECEDDEPGRQRLCLTVVDTGIGIDPDRIERLFQPFTQAEGDTTRRYGGTGLGLAISARLAELMEGKVEMESTPGEGTCMRLKAWFERGRVEDIEVPLHLAARGDAPRARHLPSVEEAMREGSLVLLVDDHPTNRLVIARQLALAGFASEAAADGVEGLNRWRSGRYALVLSDVHMPEMDGYQMAQAIRADEARRGLARTPIVALTAAALRGEAERCLAAGMDDYLSKPVSIPRLAGTLHRWLPHTRPADHAHEDTPVAPPQASRPPPLVESVVLDLCGGDRVEAGAVLRDYLDTTLSDLDALRRELDAGDLAALGREAHRCKGAARLVGAGEVAEAAAALEAAAKAGDNAQCPILMSDLDTAAGRLRMAIEGTWT